ncbi:hypothetical protein NM688_g3709 [Phlebia brevispora]|uniref:Uncharacterized protein n=1 Tax=Phlebia brevispora TaxID=194682 RepID=A0ACC1T5M5_9APHY|nr:hypothetical protein NM688_g3709 [Phlebia brevispora]
MSAIVKTKLKGAREALSKKDYEKAKAAASDALDYEPENYNANVFLGLALLELGDAKSSEQAYITAIKAQPDQHLAWQGISKLYESQQDWEKYADSLYKLAQTYSKSGDATKCAESLQKLLELRRNRGNQFEVAETLMLFLPESPFYAVLSELPPPDATNPTSTTTFVAQTLIQDSLPIFEELVSIYEKDEETRFTKEVDNRRKRIDARDPEQVRKEVGLELWVPSKLPLLYQEVINHPNTSDELRRETESKLLLHKQRLLYALPSTKEYADQKKALAEEVQEMINGMVLIGVQNELAWRLFIDGRDAETIADYDYKILAQFIRLFPESNLSKLLSAYFAYHHITTEEEEDEEAEKVQHQEDEEDYAGIIMDLFPDVQDTIIAHRCVGEIYQQEEDYENAIKVAEGGLALLRREESNRGSQLSAVKRSLKTMLAVSLVHFFPPKHHMRALRIIDEVLQDDENNIQCLMGRGYIMQAANKWEEASHAFRSVAELLPDDSQDGLRAQEEDAWCKVQTHDAESAEKTLRAIAETLDEYEGRERDQARCWWRLGKALCAIGDIEAAYRSFITSLKRLPSFAAAFTSLGIYYAEAASPPDPSRASKCFQKAFELDPRETEAARRLALGFAEEREWDLVEVVARRTINGEGALEGGADAVAPARYLPLNSWAWKALGVVELASIEFKCRQFVALRTETDDSLSWLRLGEAYSKAGRYAAAIKALERAQELDPDDWISSYFLGEVRRQTGQFQAAIDIFATILEKVPDELRVLLSLAQSHVEFGRAQSAAGFTARAETSFITSIQVTLRSIDTTPGFRRIAWKISADALYELSRLNVFAHFEEASSTLEEVLKIVAKSSDRLSAILPSTPTLVDDSSSAMAHFALQIALLAYDYRITLGSLDDSASASAYYDFGMALCNYARRTNEKADISRKESVSYLKEALRLDPYNDHYWNTLGNALFVDQPKTAQHAYIRALDIDPKNVSTWANLGFLYLYHSDIELANEAFYKAQVLDPDFAPAWVGQGLVATLNGHHQEAISLFEHATGMTIPVPEADIAFAKRLFDRLSSLQRREDVTPEAFSAAFFVLDRFCRQRPNDATAQHLFGLVCERLGHVDLAVEVIQRAISLLEAAYEESEDPQIEQQFAIAHTNMSRLRLLKGDYEGSQESAQVVLGLLGDPEGADSNHLALLAQAQFWSGLASFKQGQLDDALRVLDTALETAISSGRREIKGHIGVVTAQVLWTIGTPEGREEAKNRLLQSVENDPDNLMAVNTLAGMGILTEDDSLVDAALSEILALPLDQRLSRQYPEGSTNSD